MSNDAIFKHKSKEELRLLYEQFLESEKLGHIPDNELGKIRDEYIKKGNPNVLYMIQNDLLRALADCWHEEQIRRDNSMDNVWNVILYKRNGEQLINSENNPKQSGKYLCTCVRHWNGEETERYLYVMEFDAEKGNWHDCSNRSGISHNILAWTDKIKPCEFTDYDYQVGGCFVAKEKNERGI